MKYNKHSIPLTVFVLIFPFLTLFGQKGESSVIVEYRYSNAYYANVETLLSNQKEAVYVRPSLDVKSDDKEIKLNEEGGYVLPIGNIKSSAISYFMNSTNYVVNEYTVNSDNKRYIARDTSIVLSWKIDKKSMKKISDYTCFKATTNFRGRDYVAYYTEDIPLPFGPFKFKGLPGLILEIQNLEDDNKHYWVATKIKSAQGVKLPKLSELTAPSLNKYQLFLMDRKIKTDRLNSENARLPQGVSFLNNTVENLSIEKIYEWETPENDKNKK